MNDPTTRQPDGTGPVPQPAQTPPARPTIGGRSAHGPVARFFLFFGWSSVLVVVVVLALRSQALGSPLLIAVVGLTPFFAAPLAVAAVSSWLSRSAILRVATAATAAAFLFTTSPIDAIVGCGAESADDAITVYTANVLFYNDRPGDVGAAIVAQGADVVVMQETEDWFMSRLREDDRLADYRFRSDDQPGAGPGTVIWSRWPFADFEVDRLLVSDIVSATIAGPSGSFTVTGLHTLAPVRPGRVPIWSGQLQQLGRIETPTPRIMAGDFNATTDHRQFRDLLQSGWTDVHEPKGCGLDNTWPAGGDSPIPLMRLDHILVSDDFEVLDVRIGEPAGSDHRPVIASIRLR